MKRLFLTAVIALGSLLAWPGISLAQVIPTPPPTPAPDPEVYQDRAMYFRAPDMFIPLFQRHIDLSDLSSDQMMPVAAWQYPNKGMPGRIILQAESYQGTVGDWDNQFEQEMRSQFDGSLFRDKSNFALKNGMPAMFMTMSSGEGFDMKKFYIVIWDDSMRGMALLFVSGIDEFNEQQAKAFLSNATAVRYPADQ